MIWTAGEHSLVLNRLTLWYEVHMNCARPGDFVIWKGDGEKTVAVIQSINVMERTAEVAWYPTPTDGRASTSVVSCLELDPVSMILRDKLALVDPLAQHSKPTNETYEVFGVQRGDIVFIHPEGKANGSEQPK